MLRKMLSRANDARQAAPQQRAPSVYLGDHKALCQTRYGHKMYVDTRDLSVAPHIIMQGEWETWISDWFVHQINEGDRVVEVGANMGFYTILAAARVGVSGHVTAFEALPNLAKIVRQNMTINGFRERSTIINLAVADEPKTVQFGQWASLMGSGSMFSSSRSGDEFDDTVTMVDVECTTLDAANLGKVDFIKIDAEGAEPHIIKGAAKTLGSNHHARMLIEHAPEMIANSFGSVEAFHDMLSGHEFTPSVVGTDGIRLTTWADLRSIPHCDIFLTK